jgi:hypothetical protein
MPATCVCVVVSKAGHVSWADCIRELRDQIANLEIEIVKLQPTKRPRKLSGV